MERRFPHYRLGYEDPAFEGTQNPWHKVIVCRYGNICPAGGTKLWACTNSARSKAARVLASDTVPCDIKMHGTDGINAQFDVKDYQFFFKLMGAKRR